MQIKFGEFNPDGGKGLLRAVHFPQLALSDTKTGDKRRLNSEGGGVRSLPRPMKAAWVTGDGHDGGVPIGVLQEVTFQDDNVISGKGWLLDDDNGRRQEYYLETQAIFHNSVDLAEVKAKVVWESDDPDDGEAFWTVDYVDFEQWNVAATHFVDVPAFADAHGEITASYSDEIMAAFEAQVDRSKPLVVEFASTRVNLVQPEPAEVVASLVGDIVEPFDDYHRPEASVVTPFTIDADGWMGGHFAGAWGACHDGVEGRCVVAPKPAHYADFHKPGVMTDRGMVEVGPVFFLGGHPRKPLGKGDAFAAYGGVENVAGYVRVTNGRLGPWASGRIVPGLDPEAVYVARASHKSGHWRKDNTLAAIVCCNVPGFRAPGSQLALDEDGAVFDEDGEMLEMVASFRGPTPPPADPDGMSAARDAAADKILEIMRKQPGFTSMVFQTPPDVQPIIDRYKVVTGNNTYDAFTITTTTETTETTEIELDVEDDDLDLALAILELEADQT
jgi:hypothetical protein